MCTNMANIGPHYSTDSIVCHIIYMMHSGSKEIRVTIINLEYTMYIQACPIVSIILYTCVSVVYTHTCTCSYSNGIC